MATTDKENKTRLSSNTPAWRLVLGLQVTH
jgi:hypothetical protein